MKIKIPFPLITAGGLLLAIGILVAISSFAWSNLRQVVDELGAAAQPDERLAMAKDIAYAMTDAENSVQTFVVSPDSANLEPYFSGVSTVDAKLDSLRSTSATEPEIADVDSLTWIAGRKFGILYDLLKLQKSAFIDSALQAISLRLEATSGDPVKSGSEGEKATKDKAASSKDIQAAPAKKEKAGIFRRIFTKKKGADSDDEETKANIATSEDSKGNIVDLKQIRKQIAKIREQDQETTRLVQDKELALIRENQRLSISLREVINRIERAELVSRQEKTKHSEATAKEANLVIAVFSIAASLLLALVGYSVFVFAKRNAEQRRMIQYAKEQAEQLAADRERFVATMSHEIRTPMNAILGFSDQILQGELNLEQRGNAEIVKSSSLHLLEVVNGVLDFTQLSAGKLKLAQIPYRLREETNFIAELLRQPAQSKGIALRLSLAKEVPEFILGDPLRYRQVLLNLLNNAIKFTEQGHVALKLSVVEIKGKPMLSIQVEDTGIGIPKNKLDSIFGEYEQVGVETKQKYGGTGLGLSISRMLLELQGGKISVSSIPGKGTTFHVLLPFSPSTFAAFQANQGKEKPAQAVPRHLKVLVADDEAYNRLLLANMLKAWEADITEAADGEMALGLLRERSFDLLLLDIRMPNLSGIELAKRMRAGEIPGGKELPVIALTGGITEAEKDICHKNGIQHILIKPVTLDSLSSAILTSGAKPKTSGTDKPLIGDLGQLLRLAHGNVDFVEDLVQTYLVTLVNSLPEIAEAEKQKNWSLIAEICHKLAPPSNHIEAIHFYHSLKTLESAAKDGTDETRITNLSIQVDQEGKQVLSAVREAWERFKSQRKKG